MSRYRAALICVCAAVAVFVALNGNTILTGRPAETPLALRPGGPAISAQGRIWIDTDAACGTSPQTDPDDCFAILWLVSRKTDVTGISTSFGNSTGDVVAGAVTALVATMNTQGLPAPPVFIGHAAPLAAGADRMSPGTAALQAALEAGPLTVLALGPLTNIEAALRDRPDLQGNVAQLIAVMGHRPGHLFHPSEGKGHEPTWGHGPIFRDLNVAVDVDAVGAVMAMDLPVTLIPYDAATAVLITGADLDLLAGRGPSMAHVSRTAQAWLAFWKEDVGLPGFYPFDWIAAIYLVDPASFGCAAVQAQIAREWMFWIVPRWGLQIRERNAGDARRTQGVVYCPQAASSLKALLMASP